MRFIVVTFTKVELRIANFTEIKLLHIHFRNSDIEYLKQRNPVAYRTQGGHIGKLDFCH